LLEALIDFVRIIARAGGPHPLGPPPRAASMLPHAGIGNDVCSPLAEMDPQVNPMS